MPDNRSVIVIGSGPCGAMAARELVRNGIPVTMLESGSDLPSGLLVRLYGRNVYRRPPPYGIENGMRHVPTGDPRTSWWSHLAPGGLSNQWTGAVPRFAPEDFHEGERLDARYRWPITYQELAPYYEQVERLLAITSSRKDVPGLPAGYSACQSRIPRDWERVAQSAEKRGQGITALPLADGPPWMLVRRGTAFNSYSKLVQPLLRSPNFQLITGAHVLRLEWSGAEKRVTGVVYRDSADSADASERLLAAAAVVVACGPLNSTRLLFASSNTDFPNGLGNSEGILGRYLHDHPREWWVFDLDKPISPPCPSIYLTRMPYAASPPLLATSWTLGVASKRDKVRSFLPLKTQAASVQIFGTMIPEEKNYVKPDESGTDRFGQPKLQICIRYDEDVVCNMVKARQHLLGILGDAGYGCTAREIVPQLYPGSSVHYGGTIRMHNSQKYGMLDAWNRMYDVPNVVVGDASCFTTGPEKNPTLTAMAIAARAAEKLAHDLKTR